MKNKTKCGIITVVAGSLLLTGCGGWDEKKYKNAVYLGHNRTPEGKYVNSFDTTPNASDHYSTDFQATSSRYPQMQLYQEYDITTEESPVFGKRLTQSDSSD